MAKKGILLKEEVGFTPELPKPKKTVSKKVKISSAKRVEPKLK